MHGGEELEAATVQSPKRDRRVKTCAMLVMVGAEPNTGWLSELVELDDNGFVLAGEQVGAISQFATSMPGILAVGDARAGSVKRVASSAGEDSVVISAIGKHATG